MTGRNKVGTNNAAVMSDHKRNYGRRRSLVKAGLACLYMPYRTLEELEDLP